MIYKIGMDVRMIAHSGIGVRIQNILQYWKPIPNTELYLFGDPKVLSTFRLPIGAEIVPYFAPVYSVREWFGHSKMKEMDILDIPHFNVPLWYLQKSIVTIHDLIPWVFKEFHSHPIKRIYLRLILNILFARAKKIIAVSEYTKSDIIREFAVVADSIDVVYNGIDSSLFQVKSTIEVENFKKKYKLPQDFILTVGIGKGHKNLEFLLDSLEKEWENSDTIPPLVIAGSGGKFPESIKRPPNYSHPKIILLPRIPDEAMPLLYQSSRLLVYPSLYEGFGFPVVEAQATHCLVLSSSASVLPEILQDTAIFFDPKNAEDLINQLNHSLTLANDDLENLKRKGFSNSTRFNWNKSIEKIQSIYKKILKF
jgi:glycosyltransferase involved in cell wall biosynthesis